MEKKLDNKYTIDQIIPTLQEMDFMKYEGKGYQPTYTRTSLTDDLHEAFGFCTSKQIVPVAKMRNIICEIYKSPVIRLQSGLRDFFFQNAVKNRNITLDSVHPTRSSSSAQCQGAWKYAHSYLPFQLSEHLH